METIWKQQIEIADKIKVKLPAYAKVLTVQMQHGVPCIWFMVNPSEARENEMWERTFAWFGTGHERDFKRQALTYIGTVQMAEGSLVFHLFEVHAG